MRVAPRSEDDSLAKEALFTKYTELLPTALDSMHQAGTEGLVFDLLAGIGDVVAVNQTQHQNLFRSDGRMDCLNLSCRPSVLPAAYDLTVTA